MKVTCEDIHLRVSVYLDIKGITAFAGKKTIHIL